MAAATTILPLSPAIALHQLLNNPLYQAIATRQVPFRTQELNVKCNNCNSLQRNTPIIFSIDYKFRDQQNDFAYLSLPNEICRPEDDQIHKHSNSQSKVDLRNAIECNFELAVVSSNNNVTFLTPEQIATTIAIRKSKPWMKIKRGNAINLRITFNKLPSDFENTGFSINNLVNSNTPSSSEFVLVIKFTESSPAEGTTLSKAQISLKCKSKSLKKSSSNPGGLAHAGTSSPERKNLKRSFDRVENTTMKRIKSFDDSWRQYFTAVGVANSVIPTYEAIMSQQKIDCNQLARIPVETLQHLGFKVEDIAKIRTYYQSHGGITSDDEDDVHKAPSSSSSSMGSDESDGYSSDDEEIAMQLLMLHSGSYPQSPNSPSNSSPPPMAIVESVVPSSAATQVSMNRVVHQTIKLGKLIICEIKDPSTDLKSRLALADEVESLLTQWLRFAYPNQRVMTLDEVREMTESPNPPYDPPLAYYIKVLSAHLELKENNRGILKREHLLLPMEDVAKLLGLSLTKISREYQRNCVLGCGWILKGRKRSLRWPSRPLHVLLGYISEKILREAATLCGEQIPTTSLSLLD